MALPYIDYNPHEEKDQKEHILYNISSHGLNMGNFFVLPPNFRVLIPDKLESLPIDIRSDAVLWYTSFITPDIELSNLVKNYENLKYYDSDKEQSFKVYSGNLSEIGANMCPNIEYAPDKESHFRSGISKAPVKLQIYYNNDYYSNTNKKYYQEGDIVDFDFNSYGKQNKNETFFQELKKIVESKILDENMKISDRIRFLLHPYERSESKKFNIVPKSDTFMTIDHLLYNLKQNNIISEIPINKHYTLKQYIYYLKKLPETQNKMITIVSFACNNFNGKNLNKYNNLDKGILLNNYINKDNTYISLFKNKDIGISLLDIDNCKFNNCIYDLDDIKLILYKNDVERIISDIKQFINNNKEYTKEEIESFIKKMFSTYERSHINIEEFLRNYLINDLSIPIDLKQEIINISLLQNGGGNIKKYKIVRK